MHITIYFLIMIKFGSKNNVIVQNIQYFNSNAAIFLPRRFRRQKILPRRRLKRLCYWNPPGFDPISKFLPLCEGWSRIIWKVLLVSNHSDTAATYEKKKIIAWLVSICRCIPEGLKSLFQNNFSILKIMTHLFEEYKK